MSATHPTESGLVPPAISENQTCTRMICFYITDYVLNTAGEVYYKGNFFNTNVSASQVWKIENCDKTIAHLALCKAGDIS